MEVKKVPLKSLNRLFRYIRFRQKIALSQAIRLYISCRSGLMELPFNPMVETNKNRSVQVILDPVHKGWIVEKLAHKIVDYWPKSPKPKIHYVPRSGFEITHWMHYMNAPIKYLKNSKSLHTIQVTHVDSQIKLEHLKKLIKLGAIPIFMSNQHSLQVSKMINTKYNSAVILPGSDVTLILNRIKILISSNYYPDGRKNEKFLVDLARETRLDKYHFTFIGKSWDSTAKILINAGAQINLLSPNQLGYPSYETQLGILRGMDCYLYLGFDEGSLGALDAYLSGTPMIISKQGFHMEFVHRDDVTLFENFQEFKEAILGLSRREQLSSIELSRWSWYSFASRYQQLWNSLLHNEENIGKSVEN